MQKIENITLTIEEKTSKNEKNEEFTYSVYNLIIPTRFGQPVILKKIGFSPVNKSALDMANQCNAFSFKEVK